MMQLCVGNLNNFEITLKTENATKSLKAQKFHPGNTITFKSHDESKERLYSD